ncbi:MAG: hypothetical protein RLZZ603_400, partial [Actinomycetota bacterium]
GGAKHLGSTKADECRALGVVTPAALDGHWAVVGVGAAVDAGQSSSSAVEMVLMFMVSVIG